MKYLIPLLALLYSCSEKDPHIAPIEAEDVLYVDSVHQYCTRCGNQTIITLYTNPFKFIKNKNYEQRRKTNDLTIGNRKSVKSKL